MTSKRTDTKKLSLTINYCTLSVQEVEHQPGPSNLVQQNEEHEVIEQRNVSIDEPEVDSSDRLDNTVLIKSAAIGKDDKDKRKRRRELMDYDDRQRTIKPINNFSEEQINRFILKLFPVQKRIQVRNVQTQLLPKEPNQTIDDNDDSLYSASTREHRCCWNSKSFCRRTCRRSVKSS